MNTFKMQCINYLLVREWSDRGAYWEVMHNYGGTYQRVQANTIGEAIDIQLGWDDDGPN